MLKQLPRSVYKVYSNDRHEIMFYLETKTFVVTANSLNELIRLCDELFAPCQRFNTLSAYNRAWQSSQEDTAWIETDKIAA